MKRFLFVAMLFVFSLDLAAPAFAGRTVVRHRPGRTTVVHKGRHHRTTVVVHKHFPLRRRLPLVVVRPARVAVRVAPVVFLAPIVWAPVVIAVPPPQERFAWEDGETLVEDEEWTEFTLSVNDRGRELFIQIADGKAQISFAEVVFENGDTHVVDCRDRTKGPGLYPLLDFKDGRHVDHVRVVARAKTDEARVVLRMFK